MAHRTEILIVDDEPDIRETISTYFTDQGFQVHEAADGAAMRAAMGEHNIALVLLDLRIPGDDGFALCRYLREHHSAGVVMLTGSSDTHDKIIGLEIGADDYVSKPFDLRELLARVKSVLRRVQADQDAGAEQAQVETIQIGEARLTPQSQSLRTANGETVTLTGHEFKLLMSFIENPNRVLSRDQLMNLTENREWDPFDRSIDVRITRLRKKIEARPAEPRFIRTVRGSGYLFSPSGDD